MEFNLKFLSILSFLLFLAGFTAVHENFVFGQTNNSTTNNVPQEDFLKIISNTEGNQQILQLPLSLLLFNVNPQYDQNGILRSFSITLKPELSNLYNEVGLINKPKDIVFVYPIFTQAAYSSNGFYDYYNKKCDNKCLTVNIPTTINGAQSSSIAGALVLRLLGYPHITDVDIDKNPDILKQYKRVIILHNEYVTKKEFDAITSHTDVVYLYPNALYAEVKTDYNANTITLLKGHGYPDTSIKNGFDWKSDNSNYEYNIECNGWTFYKKVNNTMLNCFPEYRMLYDDQLLRTIQVDDPTLVLVDIGNWLRYRHQSDMTKTLLADFDIKGDYIPAWVSKPAIWTLNGQVKKYEFADTLRYLFEKHIIK